MRDYWYCPRCLGNFDYGEKCDCQLNKEDEWYEDEAEKTTHPELQRV